MSYEIDPTPGWKRWRNRTVGPQRVRTPDPALQLALPMAPERPVRKADLTIEQRFSDWLDANPGVMQTLHRMAVSRALAGARRISTKALIEDLRRSDAVLDGGGEPWRVNNVFSSRIARVLADDPLLADRIERRALKAE